MKQYRYKLFSQVEDLEFELLSDIAIPPPTQPIGELHNLYKQIFKKPTINTINICEVVTKIDDKLILTFNDGYRNDKLLLVYDCEDFKIGDIVLVDRDYKEDKLTISKFSFTLKELGDIREEIKSDDYSYRVELRDYDNITLELITPLVKKIVNEIKIMEQKEEKENKEKIERERLWKKNGTLKLKDGNFYGEVEGNRLITTNFELETNKPIKDLDFNMNYLISFIRGSGWRFKDDVMDMIDKLIKVNEIFKAKMVYDIKTILISSDGKKIKINDGAVRKDKFNQILRYCSNRNLSKDEVEELSKMSGIMFEVVRLESMKLQDIEIPINIIKNKNEFKVVVWDKEKVLDWGFIKSIFGSGRYANKGISFTDFKKLMVRMDIDKNYYFNQLRTEKALIGLNKIK